MPGGDWEADRDKAEKKRRARRARNIILGLNAGKDKVESDEEGGVQGRRRGKHSSDADDKGREQDANKGRSTGADPMDDEGKGRGNKGANTKADADDIAQSADTEQGSRQRGRARSRRDRPDSPADNTEAKSSALSGHSLRLLTDDKSKEGMDGAAAKLALGDPQGRRSSGDEAQQDEVKRGDKSDGGEGGKEDRVDDVTDGRGPKRVEAVPGVAAVLPASPPTVGITRFADSFECVSTGIVSLATS